MKNLLMTFRLKLIQLLIGEMPVVCNAHIDFKKGTIKDNKGNEIMTCSRR